MANKKVNKVVIEELPKVDANKVLDEGGFGYVASEYTNKKLIVDTSYKPIINYQVLTFEGKGLIGINEVLSKFKGEIVQVISFRDEIGKYTLKALCKL